MKKRNCISDLSTKVTPSKKIKKSSIDGIRNIEFDNSQRAFILDNITDSKIYGMPGTGKTFSLIYKIIKLYNDNIISRNDEYLILSQNDINNSKLLLYSRNINNKYFTQSNIKTFYSLAGIINKHLLNKSKSSSRFTSILGAYNSLKISDIIDVYDMKIFKNIKYIFIDNAQDLDKEQYDLVMQIKNIMSCKLLMFGDINQTTNNNASYFLNYDVNTYILNNNYRSQPNIINFYRELVYNNIYTQSYSNKPDGNEHDKVSIYNCNLGINFEQLLLCEIINSKIDYHDIAIVSPIIKSNENINCFCLNNILNILTKNNIPTNVNYRIDSSNMSESKFINKPNAVNLFTLHTIKGMQFKKVILLNFHLNTFGFKSSITEYNYYRNLWYIGCSRAIDKLTIFVNKNEYVFPDFFNIPENTYNVILSNKTSEILRNISKFKENDKVYSKSVTSIVYDCSSHNKLKLEETIKYNYIKEIIYNCDGINLLEYDKYKLLYGLFFEHIIQYFYEYNNKTSSNIFTKTKEYINNMYTVDIIHSARFLKIKQKYNIHINKKIYKHDIRKFKLSSDTDENILLNIIESYMINKNKEFIYLSFNNNIYQKHYTNIENSCDTMISNIGDVSYTTYIFNITLFYYCLEHDIDFLYIKNFTKHIAELELIVQKIKEFVITQSSRALIFQKDCVHPNINISGRMDIFDKDNDEIIEIKCSKNSNMVNPQHVYQLLLYYNNIFPKWDREKKLTIWNILTGEKYTIYIHPIDPFKFLCILSDISRLKLNNIAIGYDLETTGLDKETCKIIDISCIEYNLGFDIINTLVDNDITIPSEVVELTHITDKMIKENGMKYEEFVRQFKKIMSYFDKPKFIAHNGNFYDHYIMRRLYLFPRSFKYDYDLFDSKNIINYLFKDGKSLKLTELYKDVFNVRELPYDPHKAKPDVLMMIDILKKLNFKF